ncbi:MAG: tRNA (adenosine(37)-N6)-threonylcarbamoyltransferase complex dimerization subunit type 1 TsaB [Clostridia bacterium]|nr:tRNA (adenosine(37)-N6)-threonylcarbamoyltransferase complex dimerization subunit type 1 TsaB [Clostridia bacterium]
MENYLALDTCGDYLCVVAKKGEKRVSRLLPDATMKHSVLWLQTVNEVLQEIDLTLKECDFFAAVVGAGSFTGIRIGISAMKGFALAHGKRTLPVTSFDVAAYNALESGKALCLIDALHGAYYACGYDDGEVVLQPAYIMQDEVLRLQKEGYTLYSLAPLAVESIVVDPAAGLAAAVERKAKQGAFAPLTAVYVRKSSAEMNLCK